MVGQKRLNCKHLILLTLFLYQPLQAQLLPCDVILKDGVRNGQATLDSVLKTRPGIITQRPEVIQSALRKIADLGVSGEIRCITAKINGVGAQADENLFASYATQAELNHETLTHAEWNSSDSPQTIALQRDVLFFDLRSQAKPRTKELRQWVDSLKEPNQQRPRPFILVLAPPRSMQLVDLLSVPLDLPQWNIVP
jgi:hypothetical protein